MAKFLTAEEREARFRREVEKQGITFATVAARLDRRADNVMETIRCAYPRAESLWNIAIVLDKPRAWLVLK
ncbi:MAG: hypothetical protein ABFE13_11420 [Phycisphaerales bacterium]